MLLPYYFLNSFAFEEEQTWTETKSSATEAYRNFLTRIETAFLKSAAVLRFPTPVWWLRIKFWKFWTEIKYFCWGQRVQLFSWTSIRILNALVLVLLHLWLNITNGWQRGFIRCEQTARWLWLFSDEKCLILFIQNCFRLTKNAAR